MARRVPGLVAAGVSCALFLGVPVGTAPALAAGVAAEVPRPGLWISSIAWPR